MMSSIKSLDDFKNFQDNLRKENRENPKTYILIGMGTCGIATGAEKIYEILEKEIKSRGLVDVVLKKVGCLGECYNEPIVEVNNKQYNKVTIDDINVILEELNTINEKKIAREGQFRIALNNCGVINPDDINDYILHNGYEALVKVLFSMSKDSVIETIKNSGLRGRGGAGFPTGVKWESVKSTDAKEKYVVCNADEGDPGAFMDRAILEGDPHKILEAMTIAGFAVGAKEGIIYIRAEYPLAVQRLNNAIREAKEYGFLGKNILGTDFDFDIKISLGAGAFVCGEETSLLNSLQGKRGEPRVKPPFPAFRGLYNMPTIINNVETYANICPIILNGADWFNKIGTEKSKGTKVFALAGKINKVGLIEVPMGTTFRDIIYNIGGGIKDNKEFKAVQTGGPSGGCIPSSMLDTQIDYESLQEAGSMMGSGGIIVMDEDDCMVDIAKYYLDFTVDESCGKCTPCRIGNLRLHEILDKITKGEGSLEDLELIKDLGEVIKETSLCGLGQSSPNPVLSTLKHFEDEYLMHIENNECKAKKCVSLIKYVIEKEKCIGCTLCTKNCPVSCISGEAQSPHEINQDNCIKCGNCFEKCPVKAILKK